MTQPTPASRHTVDSITSDALDALYEQLEAAQQTELARQLATCDKAFASATLRAARAEARAYKAEAALDAVRDELAAIDRDRERLDDDCDAFGGGYADAAARIRTALDARANPKDQT